MKLEVTKAWCLAMARLEENVEVGAGSVAYDPEPIGKFEARDHEMTQIAFGRAVHFLRRQHQWSVEKLAADARVDLVEVVAIENDPAHRPEPRTVSQLAHVFHLNPKAFQQLAGNAVIKDTRLQEEATRFAARSGSINHLSKEENDALEQFVAVLSTISDERGKPSS